MLYVKSFDVRQLKSNPTSTDLDLINQFSQEEVKEGDVYIGRMKLANDQYDRSHERFPHDYLEKFAETIVGKSVLGGHDYRSVPLGRFYKSELIKEGDVEHLVPSYYLDTDDPITRRVQKGIASYVSIGFNPDKRLCDLCGKDYDGWWFSDDDEEDYCTHLAGRDYDGQKCTITYGGDVEKVEAVEGSFVWLGCQYGAETMDGKSINHQAKAAHFERGPGRKLVVPGYTKGRKEGKVEDQTEKGAEEKGAPNEKARNPRLEEAGQKYIDRMLLHIKTRYDALKMDSVGNTLVEALKTQPVDAIEAAEKEADKMFDEKFPKATLVENEGGSEGAVVHKDFDPNRYQKAGGF